MFQHTANIKEFNGLIKVLNSSLNFYEKAISEIENPKVKKLLKRVHSQHASSINTLEPHTDLDIRKKEDSSSFAVEARNIYTQALSKLQSDSDLAFIDQLEEVEDKILKRMDDIDTVNLPLLAQPALIKTRLESQITHKVMKSLQNVRESAKKIH